ncbi:hypothetical protein [Desulfofundulus thermocisternus]|jgi:hypothetical protein|uniref:hypothetical protein n=1 Tax=Desulfofundulus thermocisternus TaxID=42471 RepID=UPI000480C616|nr:hypothetical protein [Desulfofundulus thermocisternus]
MFFSHDARKIVVPNIVHLARNLKLVPGQVVELDCPRATLMNIAFRIRTTGTVDLFVEEENDRGWETTGRQEVEEGEMVWHYILKRPCFRLRLANPSPAVNVEVSIDVNLPCLKEPGEINRPVL